VLDIWRLASPGYATGKGRRVVSQGHYWGIIWRCMSHWPSLQTNERVLNSAGLFINWIFRRICDIVGYQGGDYECFCFHGITMKIWAADSSKTLLPTRLYDIKSQKTVVSLSVVRIHRMWILFNHLVIFIEVNILLICKIPRVSVDEIQNVLTCRLHRFQLECHIYRI
jgi:hypothetical protein